MTHLDKATLEWVVKWHEGRLDHYEQKAEEVFDEKNDELCIFYQQKSDAHADSAAHFRKMIEEMKG